MRRPTKERTMAKRRLSPGEKAELAILGIGNPGEVSKSLSGKCFPFDYI